MSEVRVVKNDGAPVWYKMSERVVVLRGETIFTFDNVTEQCIPGTKTILTRRPFSSWLQIRACECFDSDGCLMIVSVYLLTVCTTICFPTVRVLPRTRFT